MKFFAQLQLYFQCLCQCMRRKGRDRWKSKWNFVGASMLPHPRPLSLCRHLRGQAQGKFLFVCLPKSFIPLFKKQHISHELIGCSALSFINSLCYLGWKSKLKSSTSLSVWSHRNIMFLKLKKESIFRN